VRENEHGNRDKEKISHSNYGRDFLNVLFQNVVMGVELKNWNQMKDNFIIFHTYSLFIRFDVMT